jgi:hypothetical protein
MRKVKITKLPEKKHGGSTQMFGAQTPPVDNTVSPGPGSFHGGNDPEIKINRTLKPTTKENATLEAEVGETIVTNLSGEGIPEFYKVGGKRHYNGGTYLNVPENSFIFSRDKSMKIDNPNLLKMFGKSGKGKKSYTPAELSMSYDLNTYREILADPSSSKRDKETAEQMIKNYNLKLGALALVQESIKGFDNGIPEIAMPYLQSVGIDPAQLVNPQMAPTPEQMQTAMYGKEVKSKSSKIPAYKKGGELPKYQNAGQPKVRNLVYDATSGAYVDIDNAKIVMPEVGDIVQFVGQDGTADPVKQKVTEVNLEEFKAIADYVTDDEATKLGDYTEPYARLADRLTNDKALRDKVATQFKENIKAAKAKPGILSQQDIDKAANMSEDEIIKTILKAEKQFMEIRSAGLNYDENKTGDFNKWQRSIAGNQGYKHPQGYLDAVNKLGEDPLSNIETLIFQTGMSSLNSLNQQKDESVQGLDLQALGTYDKLSGLEGIAGGSTTGTFALTADPEYTYKFGKLEEDQKETFPAATFEEQQVADERMPWHTQDLINLRGAQRESLDIEKYRPFAPPVQADIPSWRDVDFRGAAGRVASNVAGIAEQLGEFAGPQSYNARTADVQAKSAADIAQLREQEYATNQTAFNRWRTGDAAMKNQLAGQEAARSKRLFDETAVANQQFDNAKRQARQAVRAAEIQGLSNLERTQFYNEMYPDFNITTQADGFGTGARSRRTDSQAPITPSSGGADFASWKKSQQEMFPNISDDVLQEQWYKEQERGVESQTAKQRPVPYGYGYMTPQYPYAFQNSRGNRGMFRNPNNPF